ncbi:MAG TPA: amidophosphoribosyltransferase [Gammaproteobacteria bacterium]|nr:amidophosphoribosyltransferase [Gammaproteobacteria bacterium]
MCGIIGIYAQEPVNQALYDGLTVLQHRGQDAAGIATSDGHSVNMRKDSGLVRDVFHTRHMLDLEGHLGIGHVRYPTAGCESSTEAQPFYVNSPFGIALAHNGNLTNCFELQKELFKTDLRHLNTNSDSEVLTNVLAHELNKVASLHMTPDEIFTAVKAVHARVKGAYAVVAMIVGQGILAFRDPCGIRPMVYGKRQNARGPEHIVASESVALDVLGYETVRDIRPGEALFIDMHGRVYTKQCAEVSTYSPCIFEHVYFARPDSLMDGISVHKTRLRMGIYLGRKIKREWPNNNIDVIIPIPDTSRTSALQLAKELKITYREGFIKNRYIGRTFIMPGQEQRKKSVRQKLNPISLEFRNKNVLLVDDSIVRGTTSGQIIQMARDAGARRVYFASAAPPVRYPNVYGIDMPSPTELVAHNRTEKEICAKIGADRLFYQDLDDLIKAAQMGNKTINQFDCSCFNGEYVTGDVNQSYLELVDGLRNDHSRSKTNDTQAELKLTY